MKHLKIKISEAIDFANLTIDAFDTELLMCFVKKVDRSYLYAHRNEFLTNEEKIYFFELAIEIHLYQDNPVFHNELYFL